MTQTAKVIQEAFDPKRVQHLIRFAQRPTPPYETRLAGSDLDPDSKPRSALEVFRESLLAIGAYIDTSASLGVSNPSSVALQTLKTRIEGELQKRGYEETDFLSSPPSNADFMSKETQVCQFREAAHIAYNLERAVDIDYIISNSGLRPEEMETFKEAFKSYAKALSNSTQPSESPLSDKGVVSTLLDHLSKLDVEATSKYASLHALGTGDEFDAARDSVKKSITNIADFRKALNAADTDHEAGVAAVAQSIGGLQGSMQEKHQDRVTVLQDASRIASDDSSASFGASYQKLLALGVTVDEIIKLEQSFISGSRSLSPALSTDRINEIELNFNALKSALSSDFINAKFPSEIQLAKSLFSGTDWSNGISDLVVQWSHEAVTNIRNEIATAEQFLASAYDPKRDSSGTIIKDSFVLKPDGAFLLVGEQRASSAAAWATIAHEYDRFIALFESDFCKKIVGDNLYDPDHGANAFDRANGINSVLTLVEEDPLIERLAEVHDSILISYPPDAEKKSSDDDPAKANLDRTDDYLSRLELAPVYEQSGVTGSTGLERYLDILRKNKRAVCLGTLVNDTITTDLDEQRMRHIQAEEMLRSLYIDKQRRETSGIVAKKLDNLIEKNRNVRDTRLNNIGTFYTDFTHRLKSIFYSLNALAGTFLKVACGAGNVGAMLLGVGAVAAYFIAMPLFPAFVAGALIVYFPTWVMRPILKLGIDYAKDGREHEQEVANLKLAAQHQRLKESTDDIDQWIAVYVVILEDLLDRFEPSDKDRRDHVRYFIRRILSAQGIIETTAENRGIVREDLAYLKGFAGANAVISSGWADIPKSQQDAIERAIKVCGFKGKTGNEAWKEFTDLYGSPKDAKHQFREILPIPDGIRSIPFLDVWARSTIPYAKRQENDLSPVMRNIFGDDMLLTLSAVNKLRIQPDGSAVADTLSRATSRVTSKMPSFGEGKDGRNAQLTRRESVFNFLGNLLAETEITQGKKSK
jgi:hypothetical protein